MNPSKPRRRRVAPLRRLLSGVIGLGLLALNGDAAAMHRDIHGLGQVLIYPYYTVNAGHASLLSLTNASGDAKALRLRFREALNGRAVVDINLYLLSYDVWTAAVIADADGGTRLVTTDLSCVVPALPGDGLPFDVGAYTGDNDDDGPNEAWRTREGFVEVIEMGVLADSNGIPFNAATSFRDALELDAVNRVNSGCARVAAAWNDGGVWRSRSTAAVVGDGVGVLPPSGRLLGQMSIVDVTDGVVFGYRADAIEGFFTLPDTTLHHPPGATRPTLADAETAPGEAAVRLFATPSAGGNLGGVAEALDLRFASGRPDAVSALYMSRHLQNEFNVDPQLGAMSEWVVTFPTKHLHLEQPTNARRRPFFDNLDDDDSEPGTAGNSVDSSVFDPEGASCFAVRAECGVVRPFYYFNRESGPDSGSGCVEGVPPDRPLPRAWCWQTNVVPFGGDGLLASGETALLGSRAHAVYNGRGLPQSMSYLEDNGEPVRAGWQGADFAGLCTQPLYNAVMFDGVTPSSGDTRSCQLGLPALGLWVARYRNSNAQPGVLADYSTAMPHAGAPEFGRVRVFNEGEDNERIEPVP